MDEGCFPHAYNYVFRARTARNGNPLQLPAAWKKVL
jgi:hypothetical protein